MRLAFGLGRTVDELEATMTHREWVEWVAFHGLYDLPDEFLTTGQLGALVASAAGSKRSKPEHFAPYYKARRGFASIKSFIMMAAGIANSRPQTPDPKAHENA